MNDGGPVHPIGELARFSEHPGMSLLDLCAVVVLHATLRSHPPADPNSWRDSDLLDRADFALAQAQMMVQTLLAEREHWAEKEK